MNRHCGDSKPHPAHDWWYESEVPLVHWSDEPPDDLPRNVIRVICPGTRKA